MSDNDQSEQVFARLEPELLKDLTSNDVEDFVRLHAQLSSSDLSSEQVANFLAAALNSSSTCVFVIRDKDGRVQSTATGFIGYIPYGCKGWVEDVVTDISFRGRGAGTVLMDALHDWFISQGAKTANLTSNQTREAAGRLYERKGYVERQTRVYQAPLS